jgi:hypothetical protein
MSVFLYMRYDYVAVAVALIALLVAIYAVVTQPPAYTPPPTASATVKLIDSITVDVPGAYTVELGWIHIKDAPAVVELYANYTYIWFLLDGVRYGNPVITTLQPGNYTVSAIIAVYGNATKINISYKVVG